MDWQATELNNAWRYAFMGLVRQSPAHQDATLLAQGLQGFHFFFGFGLAAAPAFRHRGRFGVYDDLPLTGVEVARRFTGVKWHKRASWVRWRCSLPLSYQPRHRTRDDRLPHTCLIS